MTRRKKGLTKEDKLLWDAVKKTANPMHLSRPVKDVARADQPKPKVPQVDKPSLKPFKVGSNPAKKAPDHKLAPTIGEHLRQAPVRMDRKQFGKMRKGKLVPEARIDLHGMTVAQAHPALTRFILNSWAMDRRLVLVITGKGKHRDDDGPIPVRTGVLKHQVPHWLHTSPLREAVLQVHEAHLKHGGTGAYYVYLRRPR
ncbi:Smr/MutS family protein [Celeribacter litoreus]|uniref:Smr/MutS family protein n=1 Tax=Celeribacter litoreus TaxID=2876714 RepID=UPI001CCCDAB7|nr:Smr/MutS family protein [Celeribacter litoreus]MCA0042155.1 Smr/MutS family protein [Celeribacter litoreus]